MEYLFTGIISSREYRSKGFAKSIIRLTGDLVAALIVVDSSTGEKGERGGRRGGCATGRADGTETMEGGGDGGGDEKKKIEQRKARPLAFFAGM